MSPARLQSSSPDQAYLDSINDNISSYYFAEFAYTLFCTAGFDSPDYYISAHRLPKENIMQGDPSVPVPAIQPINTPVIPYFVESGFLIVPSIEEKLHRSGASVLLANFFFLIPATCVLRMLAGLIIIVSHDVM